MKAASGAWTSSQSPSVRAEGYIKYADRAIDYLEEKARQYEQDYGKPAPGLDKTIESLKAKRDQAKDIWRGSATQPSSSGTPSGPVKWDSYFQ